MTWVEALKVALGIYGVTFVVAMFVGVVVIGIRKVISM